MADDIQSNIRINVDTASAMDSIRLLQNQISAFHTQMAKMGAASVADSRNMQQNLINSINSTGAFTASMTKVKTTAEQFSYSLEKNKLTMGEYFRYAGGATKTFGRLFAAEFETINKVARERVKDLQSQYIKLGRDASGAMQAIKVRPLTLDMNDLATKTQIAAQRQQLLNQLLKQGSTNLLNFGKNTQWAGRQLMVGFTVPLSIMGAAAMRAYKDIEEASIRLKRVYGDLGTTNMEADKMVKEIQLLAQEYTKYGIAVKDSMEMAATAAATGKKGAELLAQVSSSARLAVLGGVDQQMALKTTISLTDAFGVSTKQLSKDINFLNAVENQTVLSIEDMTIAIPKAAPVIQQLGGDVKDLAFFLTAMKEGGINASESANALKSGLASLINPTNTASKMLQGFGINLRGIVQGNKGDVKQTVIDFAQALDKLDPLNRAKAIEQLFGKFQFARMSTLFKNVIEQGSQASEVLKLASQSSLELSMLAQKELNKIQQSPLYKFQKAIADFQTQLAPVGEQFMKALTPIINFGTDVLKNFNNLGEGVKGFIVKFVAIAGVVGPVLLMSFGLIANAVANVIKGFALMKDIFNKTGKSSLSLGEQVNYMTQEQIQAAAIASSLDQVHSKLKQTFTSEAAAVDMLTAAYQRSVTAQQAFAVPITPRGPVKKLATGGFVSGPGTGTSDSIPAMLSNGEAVIPAKSVSQNRDLVQSLINNSLPRFATGGIIGNPSKSLMQQVNGTSAVIAYGAHQPFTSAHQGIAQRGMSMAEESGIPFFQFTSNQGKAKRSVLGDDLKSRMISEAIGRNPEFAKNPFELMAILSKAGIKDVNILLGEDRMKSPVWEAAAKEFGITITKTGIPRPVGSTSGTMTRAAAASGNFGMFESLLASGMSKSTKNEIFKTLFTAGKARKFAFGGMVRGPGGPTDDLVPANLSNGEAVIDAATTRKNPRIISALFAGKKIALPGYAENNSESFNFAPPSNASQAVQNKIAAMQQAVADGTLKIEQSNLVMERTLSALSTRAKVTFSDFIKTLVVSAEEVTGRNIGSQVNKAYQTALNKGANDYIVKYSASGVGTMESQMSAAGRTDELDRAKLRLEAEREISQRMGLGGQLQIDRAHRVDIGGSSNKLFRESWQPDLINPSTHSENAISNALTPGKGTGVAGFNEKYTEKLKNLLDEGIVKQEEYDSILGKVNKNIALSETELSTQAKVLKRITETEQDFLLKNKALRENILRTIAGSQVSGGLSTNPAVGVISPAQRDAGLAQLAAARARLGTTGAQSFINAQNAVLDNPANDPAIVSRDSRKRNSPHQQASIDGRDDGIAYNKARSAEVQKASQSGRVAGQGGNRVSSEGNMIFLPGQGYVSEGQLARDQALMNSPMIGPKEGTRLQKFKSGFNTESIYRRIQGADQDKLAGGIRNKAFGASGAMAIGSMVLPGEAGQMMGIASMLTSFGGMGAGGIAKGLKSLSPNLIGLGLKFTKLIPYVGIAVTAFEAFDTFVMPMIKKNSKAYEAVANTLSITQEKLDKINGFFGTELKLTGVRAATIASGDQTKGEATIAQQFQQSQEFKDLYEEDAKEMAKLTNQQFKRAMEAMAMDLSGQGLEPEGVTAIVDAIAISAGKTRVSVSPELFSIANPEAKMLMQKNLKSAFSQISEGSKGINPAGTLDPTGRTLQAGRGDFDNYYLTPVDPESVAKIKAGTAEIASYMSALSGQFENGQISVKEFQVEYAKLISLSKQQPGTQGIESMRAAMISLNSEIGNALTGLNNVQFLAWQEAVNAGVVLTKEALDAAVYATKEVKEAYTDAVKEATTQQYAKRAKEQKLRKQITNIENSSVNIAKTEQKINDKYDKRIEQLEKIKKLNDQLAKSQQGQLTLAEALNKGDIAAAARAAIDVQNNDIQASLDNQKDGLDAARKAEIAPLKGAQESNTAAVKSLTAQIDKLNTDGVVVKNPEGETGPALKSAMGNDPMGWLGLIGNAALDVSAVGLVKNLITLFTNPGNFFKEKTQQYLPPGTAVTQDGRLVLQRPETPVQTNANGGHIRGPGTGTSDDIPAMLSNGEYVIRANAVKTIGVDTLNKLNQADRLGFASGGMVRHFKGGGYNGYKDGGYVPNEKGLPTNENLPADTANFQDMHGWFVARPGAGLNKRGDEIYGYSRNEKTGKYTFDSAMDAYRYYSILLKNRRALVPYIEQKYQENRKSRWMLPDAADSYRVSNLVSNKTYGPFNGLTQVEARTFAKSIKAVYGEKSLPKMWKQFGLNPKLLGKPIKLTPEQKRLYNAFAGEITPSLSDNAPRFSYFADGGYVGPRPAPQWDEKGRWVVSRGESYWSTAEKTMPGGMNIGPWWSRILKSNIDPETGKERRLYRNSRIWIPGSKQPYPPKIGIPRTINEKKPLYIGGMPFRGIGENHLGFMGVGGFGMMKMYANGGLVKGYKDGGIADIFSNPMGWINGLISGMYGSGGNPSSYLNASAGAGVKGAAKNTLQGYKDWVFDPSDPVDYAFAALPGLKPASAVAKKASEAFKFPLVLQTPKKDLKITQAHLLKEGEGVTPGAFRTINGFEHYVKRPETPLETTGELLASTLWSRLGLGGPKLQMINKSTVASKIIPNLIPSSPGFLRQYIENAPNKVQAANTIAKATRQYINEALPTNALLGNSDTHGMNILFNKDTKKFENIDLGITALTAIGEDAPKYLFTRELANRTRSLVTAMKESGFNLRQTNDVLKKNGLSEIDPEDFRYSYVMGLNDDVFENSLTHKKSLTPQINKISNMLGFDLKKDISDPVNVAAINAASNPFIKGIIKDNPELANLLTLKSNPKNLESGMSGGLRELFDRLQKTSKKPVVKYANGGLVGYKDGGKAKKSSNPFAEFVISSAFKGINLLEDGPFGWLSNLVSSTKTAAKTSYELQKNKNTTSKPMDIEKEKRRKLRQLGGAQGFEAGLTSFMQDLGTDPTSGGILSGIGDFIERDKALNFVLSTLSLPVNLIGGGVTGAFNAAESLSKGDLGGAFTSGLRATGDAFASTYGSMLDSNKDNVYRGQFQVAAEKAYNMNLFNAQNDAEAASIGRIIGGTGDLAFDPLNYAGIGLAAKATKLGTVAKAAGASVKNTTKSVVKPIKTGLRDVSTYIAAKKFGLQTKNVPPLINPGKGTRPSLEAAEKAVSKMNLGKNMALDIRTGVTDYDMAEMFDTDAYKIPEDMFAGLQGSFRDTKAPGLKGMAGSVSGTIFNKNLDGVLSAEDIFIKLEDAYKGKGIAKKFTTQYMELLKNMGVKKINIDASLSDGGYAWAKAGFKFDGRPNNLIERMELIDPFVRYNSKKFDELLERLKTADIEDLPMPKEILGLKTDWRKYLSKERLQAYLTGDRRYPGYNADPYAAMRMADEINPNAKTLGELIMRGSKWQGVKELGGNSVIKQFFDNSVGMGRSVFDKFKESRNMFEKRVFEGDVNGIGYRIKGKDFAFQGYEQDFSELSDLLDVNVVQLANKSDIDVPKGFVGASAPTPVAILEAALKINPGNKKLQIMLDNFKEMKIGKPETRMLDNIAASISIDGKMKPLANENTDGFAMMLSSLAGNRRAKKIVNKKTNAFQKIMNDRMSSAKQKEKDEWAAYQKQFGDYGDAADPSQVSMIHSSKHPIVRDEDGNISLYPLGQYNPLYARASLHFSAEDSVKSHLSGTWDASETKIVSPLSSMINDNGLPANLYPLDTWWMRNPGQPVKLSNASVIRPFTDYKAYTEELVSRGLLEPGKMPPTIITDPKTKDVLYALKEEYSSVDRFQIQKAMGSPDPSYRMDRIKGTEASILEELALDLAKKQLGINTGKAHIGEHQLYPDSRQKQILALAKNLGIGADRYHTGKPVQFWESPFHLKQDYGQRSSGTKFSDVLESLRMSILKGHFKTSTSSDGPFSDINFKPRTPEEEADLPEFANGGMVRRYARGGFVLPSPEPIPTQYAMGGMVRAANGGMLLNGKMYGGFANGGMVLKKFAEGGYSMGTDTVPAMLTPGEFVIKKSAVDRIGASTLAKINGYADGGLVGGSSTVSGDSVYNNNTYEVNVNVSSNSNPDQIANAVMNKIRQIDNGRVRGLGR